MYRLALRTIGDRELAADAVQETTRYWMGKFPGFVLSGEVTSFLYPVVRHNAIRLVEKQRKARGAGSEVLEGTASQADASGSPEERADRHRRLAEAVARLPEGQREAIHLRYADGMSLAQISEVLHVPIGTVKSRISLAVRALASDPSLADLADIL